MKARELINERKEYTYGPYGGGVGSVSFTGDMEIALSLKTIVFSIGNR